MADTDPVRVVVEIIDEFSDELRELREELEALDAKEIDVDFELDDDGDIERVKRELESIDDLLDATLFINVHGAARAEAIKQALSSDMRSTLHIDTDRDGAPGRGLRDVVDSLTDDTINDIVGEHDLRWSSPSRAFRNFEGFDAPSGFGDVIPDYDMRRMDLVEGRRFRAITGIPLADWADDAAGEFDDFGRTLAQYRPSIMDWWNIIGLLIPIMISLAGAAIGLAAALGAVAVGAASIIGLGLLGWGESTTAMMQNLQTEAQRLMQTLFGVFRPVGVTFQPITEEWLQSAPHQLQRLVDPLQRMEVFAEGLEQMGAGVVGWLAEVVNAMADLADIAMQVTLRFGGAVGNFLIEALSSMLKEVYRNQDAYIKMAELLLSIIVIIFNVSKVVTLVVAQFGFLFDVLAALTGFLSNKWAVALLTTIVTLFSMYRIILLLIQVWTTLQYVMTAAAHIGIMRAVVPSLYKAMTALAEFIGLTNAATFSWMRLAAVTGVGLLLAGAGWMAADAAINSMTPPGGMGGGRSVGGDTYIQIDGNVEQRQMDRLLDEVGPATRNEMSIQNSMSGGK